MLLIVTLNSVFLEECIKVGLDSAIISPAKILPLQKIEAEQNALIKALVPLKAQLKAIETYQLPKGRGARHVIRLITTDKCPKSYPRSIGIPRKRPLS